MSARTQYISAFRIRAMDQEIVGRVAAVIGGVDVLTDEYAAATESAIRARGEHDLAEEWLDEVASCASVGWDAYAPRL